MTQIEKDALWVKSQRKKLAKQISSISAFVAEQILKAENVKYNLSFEASTTGFIELMIFTGNPVEIIDRSSTWCLDSVFQSGFLLPKESIESDIEKASQKIEEVMAMAKKYVKLNAKAI